MTSLTRALICTAAAATLVAASACGSSSGPRKVVVNEGVCGGQVRLLRSLLIGE